MISRIRRRGANWEHVAFVSTLTLVSGLYLADTLSVSTRINNIILILPVATLIIVLHLFVVACEFVWLSPARSTDGDADAVRARPASSEAEDPAISAQPSSMKAAIGLVVALGIYVSLYPYLGLDLATLLFIGGALPMLGVRSLPAVTLYAVIFTVVVVGGAKLLLPYPMPMMLP